MSQTQKWLAAWIALGLTGVTTSIAALSACLLVPVLGWFIGFPFVLACALAAGSLWICGLFVIILLHLPSVIAAQIK